MRPIHTVFSALSVYAAAVACGLIHRQLHKQLWRSHDRCWTSTGVLKADVCAPKSSQYPTLFLDCPFFVCVFVLVHMWQINLLETQLGQRNLQEQQHEQPQRSAPGLQQQLAASQQQLQATQQELRVLRDEHRQYVAHTSTLLTQLQTQVQQVLTGQHMMPPPLPSLQSQVQQHQQQPMSLPGYSSRLRPAPVGGQQGIHGAAAGGCAAVGVAGAAAAAAIEKGMRDNSTDRLLQISSFIRQQLHEQEQGAAAQPGLSDSTSSKAPGIWPAGNRSGSNSMQQQQQPLAYAAAEANTGWTSTSPSKPLTAAAAGGEAVGPGAGSTQACSSPSRRKAALLFTPAVADSVPLPSYAAMRQQGRGVMGSPAAAGGPLSQQQAVLGTTPSSPSRGWRGQDRGSHAAGEAAGSMGAFGSPSSGWKGQDRGTQSAAAEAAGSPSRGWRGQGTSNGDPRASVGSPQRLHAAQIPQLLPMHGPTGRGLAGPQQQHRPAGNADGSNSTGMEPPRALSSLRVPPAAAAAAAVWQAELASSPRPQQMQVCTSPSSYAADTVMPTMQWLTWGVGKLSTSPRSLCAELHNRSFCSVQVATEGCATLMNTSIRNLLAFCICAESVVALGKCVFFLSPSSAGAAGGNACSSPQQRSRRVCDAAGSTPAVSAAQRPDSTAARPWPSILRV